MGFCLFNNVALAAQRAQESRPGSRADRRLGRASWQRHARHLLDRRRVGFFSIHRWPFYPGTGDDDETGSGRGLGCIVNEPVQFGTPVAEFHARFERALIDLAAKMKPQLVLVSAGFDAHREDPIGSLDLETEDFAKLTKTVLAVAQQHAQGRVVSLLEGGYNPMRLAQSVETHLIELLRATAT